MSLRHRSSPPIHPVCLCLLFPLRETNSQRNSDNDCTVATTSHAVATLRSVTIVTIDEQRLLSAGRRFPTTLPRPKRRRRQMWYTFAVAIASPAVPTVCSRQPTLATRARACDACIRARSPHRMMHRHLGPLANNAPPLSSQSRRYIDSADINEFIHLLCSLRPIAPRQRLMVTTQF